MGNRHQHEPARRQSPVSRVLVLAALVALASCRALAEPPAPEPLEPSWSWSPAAGIEWASAVGAQYVVAATRDAHLQVMDVRAGPLSTEAPLIAGPGVVLVESDFDAARTELQFICATLPAHMIEPVFCFDRFRIHALQPGPQPAFLWHAAIGPHGFVTGEQATSAPARVFRGDPEELRRIVAACATQWGVLVADDAGHLALLDRRNGRVRWEQPCAATVDLHLCVHRDAAVVSWREAPRLAGLALNIPSGKSHRIMIAAQIPWPRWARLLDAGLLLANADRIALLKLPGGEELWHAETPSPILAATLQPLQVLPNMPGGPTTDCILFGRMDGNLDTVNLATGKTLWSVAKPGAPALPWDLLRVWDHMVCSSTRGTLTMRSDYSGRPMYVLSGDRSDRVIDFATALRTAWVLRRAEHPDGARLHLSAYGWPLVIAGSPPVYAPLQCVYDLGPADSFLGAAFTCGRLLVTTRSELRAYALP